MYPAAHAGVHCLLSSASVRGCAAPASVLQAPPAAQAAADEVVLWVPRVMVCFLAEDPFVFARRHADAHRGRARAESLLRYNLYIDCMPTEDVPPLPAEQVGWAGHQQLGWAGAGCLLLLP